MRENTGVGYMLRKPYIKHFKPCRSIAGGRYKKGNNSSLAPYYTESNS
jgi:hypothetical protein